MVAYMASLTWEGMFISPPVSPKRIRVFEDPASLYREFNSDHGLVCSPPSSAQMAQSVARLVSYLHRRCEHL